MVMPKNDFLELVLNTVLIFLELSKLGFRGVKFCQFEISKIRVFELFEDIKIYFKVFLGMVRSGNTYKGLPPVWVHPYFQNPSRTSASGFFAHF